MSLSTAIVASAAMEEGQAAPAKPARQTPALWLPRVDSLAEFGLMISRQLTQCRRYGGHLSVLWLEAAPADAGDDATLAGPASGEPPAAGDGPAADAFADLARKLLVQLETIGALKH